MKITIELDTNNQAFDEENGKPEFARVINTIAEKLVFNCERAYHGVNDFANRDFKVMDSNGNQVGYVMID